MNVEYTWLKCENCGGTMELRDTDYIVAEGPDRVDMITEEWRCLSCEDWSATVFMPQYEQI